MSNLVLVESPSKAKTIEKYLGKGYKVAATVGHIIDLPSNKLAVDLEHGYKPEFSVMDGKKKVINSLKKKVPKKGKVYLAMDPDREGEAIAYHVVNALELKDDDYKRITFHEITKDAVNDAIKKPGKIDDDLVQAQFARRVLDRLVGYKVSGILWKKMWYGLSAGRVQSVALRLIVERELERRAFDPKEYWDVDSVFIDVEDKSRKLKADLYKKNNKKYKPKTKDEVDGLKKELKGNRFKVAKIKSRKRKRKAYPPFTTSTLQQAGNNVLGFSSKKTMAIAQKLYQAGFITYMRTDSVNLSKKALKGIRSNIKKNYGDEYLPKKANYFKNKSRLAQEAHEAIRPTSFDKDLKSEIKKLGKDNWRLYDLIYKRTLSSQMKPRIMKIITVILENEEGKDKYKFKATAAEVLFDGWKTVYKSSKSDSSSEDIQLLDKIDEKDIYLCDKINGEQKFTKPKARYTEASLVKTLEKYGVGRPSTYASIISTIIARKYVEKDGKSLKPTDIGEVVNEFLKDNFSRLVDFEYTAKVEEDLDSIAEGKVKYEPFIESQFKPLMEEIDDVKDNVKKEDVVVLEKSDEECPKCGDEMVVKIGRYGKFLSCAKFPDCDGIKSLADGDGKEALSADNLDQKKYVIPKECPECDCELELKKGRYGKFWACKKYPDCKGTVPMLLKEECPECGSNLVERKGKWGKMFIGCSGYPDCKYIKKSKKKSKKGKK